jgi:hypothetical protein
MEPDRLRVHLRGSLTEQPFCLAILHMEEVMNDKRFPIPVMITLGETGQRAISSVWEAIECLRSYWPTKKGPCYRRALQACMDALDGWQPAHKARHAFISAAREAGVFLDTRVQ